MQSRVKGLGGRRGGARQNGGEEGYGGAGVGSGAKDEGEGRRRRRKRKVMGAQKWGRMRSEHRSHTVEGQEDEDLL